VTRVLVVLAAAGLLLVAGCGGGEKQTTTTSTTPQAYRTAIRVYFLRDGKVQPVLRNVKTTSKTTEAIADAAIKALAAGPSRSEAQLGLASAVPSDFAWQKAVVATDGAVGIGTDQDLSHSALAQVVYTLAQFPVPPPLGEGAVNEHRYSVSDFEDETPAILVESPLPFQTVQSPLRVKGTANTFEATFQYDLVGPDGKVLKTHFVTATSGTGTRGTFAFTVPYTVERDGPGKLVVYERSAEDGSRIHVVEIPLRLTR